MERISTEQLQPMLSRFPLRQAYLFGSHARGTVTTLSDIDIALLYEPSVDTNAMESQIFAELSHAFKTDNIDLIDLATASPLLAHRAVLRGIPIITQSAHDTALFKTKILHAYEDTRYLRELKQKAFLWLLIMHR